MLVRPSRSYRPSEKRHGLRKGSISMTKVRRGTGKAKERRIRAARRSLTHGDGLGVLTEREFEAWFNLFSNDDDMPESPEEFCMTLCFYAAMAGH